MLQQMKEMRGKTGAAAVVGLGAAAFWLVLVAIIGAIAVSGDGDGGGGDDQVSAVGVQPGSGETGGGTASTVGTTPHTVDHTWREYSR